MKQSHPIDITVCRSTNCPLSQQSNRLGVLLFIGGFCAVSGLAACSSSGPGAKQDSTGAGFGSTQGGSGGDALTSMGGAAGPSTDVAGAGSTSSVTDGGSNASGGSGPCVPRTCDDALSVCGIIDDNCGHALTCGTCAKGQVCDPTTHTCVSPASVCGSSKACGVGFDACKNVVSCSATCAAGTVCVSHQCVTCQPVLCDGRCGKLADGCGSTTDCGTCPTGQVCDAMAHTCEVCAKKKCTDYPAGVCGQLSDGCGSLLTCTCPTTKPDVCVALGAECGTVNDACIASTTRNCGTCATGSVCTNNQCVPCVPTTCDSKGAVCGTIPDGCGGKLTCGKNNGNCEVGYTCSTGNTCDLCTPTTCAAKGANCGTLSDGCGVTLTCGSTCPTGQACLNNVCKDCTPKTCADLHYTCGTVDDGCGVTLNCGSCLTTEVCRSNVCASCTPKSCADLGKSCGKVDDGCGHTIQCAGCGEEQVCLSNGTCCQQVQCDEGMTTIPDGCGGTLYCG